MKALEVKNVVAGYTPEIDVLNDVSLNVKEGEVVALIGTNGAGKSTLLNVISGILHPKRGSVTYKGERINRLEPHEIVERGIVQVPEERGIFGNLTVEENLGVACQTKRAEKKRADNFRLVFKTFPVLEERIDQSGGTLSGGEQQMLAIGRGFMAEPEILMLDDLSLGLAPKLVEEIYSVLKDLRDRLEITVLLVEQNVELAIDFAERAYVLSAGKIVQSEKSKKLRSSGRIRKTYIGL